MYSGFITPCKRKASRVNRRQRAGSAKRAILATVLGVPSIINFSQRFMVYALSHIARSNKTTVYVNIMHCDAQALPSLFFSLHVLYMYYSFSCSFASTPAFLLLILRLTFIAVSSPSPIFYRLHCQTQVLRSSTVY